MKLEYIQPTLDIVQFEEEVETSTSTAINYPWGGIGDEQDDLFAM